MKTYRVWFTARPSVFELIKAATSKDAIKGFAEKNNVVPSSYIQARVATLNEVNAQGRNLAERKRVSHENLLPCKD